MHCSEHLWSQLTVPRKWVRNSWRLSAVDCRALGYCPDAGGSWEKWQSKQVNSSHKSPLRGLHAHISEPAGSPAYEIFKASFVKQQQRYKSSTWGKCIQSRPSPGALLREYPVLLWRQESILWHIPSEAICENVVSRIRHTIFHGVSS